MKKFVETMELLLASLYNDSISRHLERGVV